jgi:hypothetical protein
MGVMDISYRKLFECLIIEIFIPAARFGKVCNFNQRLKVRMEISEEILKRELCKIDFYQKINFNHKIFVEIFKIEIARYKILMLRTFYGFPLRVYLTGDI